MNKNVPFSKTYNLESRIQRLHSSDQHAVDIFLKRDDELCSTISGTKLRKYSSLLPFLASSGVEKAILVGSRNSNNLVGLAQELSEQGIEFEFLLCGPSSRNDGLNFRLLTSLWPDVPIHWLSPEEWQTSESIADEMASDSTKKIITIPEGAFMKEAFQGAATLSDDVLKNERDYGVSFKNIFIDSGTGLSAIAFLHRYRKLAGNAHVHVVQLAGVANEFELAVQKIASWNLKSEPFDSEKILENTTIRRSTVSPSFGSVNRSVLDFIQEMAQSEGVLLDPIYSAKLLKTCLETVSHEQIEGPVLAIHSGGTHSLFDFLPKLFQEKIKI